MSCLSQPPFFLTARKAIQKDEFPPHGMKLSVILLFAFVPHQEEMTIFSLSGSSGEIWSQKHGSNLIETDCFML